MDIEQARFNMIEQQIRPWNVLDIRLLDLLKSIPREAFVRKAQQNLAFADMELLIGHDQVMMSPKLEARMLQALNISDQDSILEVGTGSGFITACLAKMGQHVTTCEYFEDLSQQAQSRLASHSAGYINYIVDDIFQILDSLGHFDVIAITGSMPTLLDAFSSHLNSSGRLFCITGHAPVMQAKLITCVAENSYREETLFETVLPALLSATTERTFTF